MDDQLYRTLGFDPMHRRIKACGMPCYLILVPLDLAIDQLKLLDLDTCSAVGASEQIHVTASPKS
jgi:hypothetical protein